MKKTNAIRQLEAHQLVFEVIKYDFNEDEIDAISVAQKIGANPEEVFKTLVCVNNEQNQFTFVIPGNYELDLKKAAIVSGSKKIELIKAKDLLESTGYIRGGCSPVGMKKQFPTFIDESAQLFEKIYVSAGVRGKQILISPADLTKMIDGTFADLI